MVYNYRIFIFFTYHTPAYILTFQRAVLATCVENLGTLMACGGDFIKEAGVQLAFTPIPEVIQGI